VIGCYDGTVKIFDLRT